MPPATLPHPPVGTDKNESQVKRQLREQPLQLHFPLSGRDEKFNIGKRIKPPDNYTF